MSKTETTQENSLKNFTKVLIADDDAPTRILLRTAIAQWGYEAVEARDGEEAWNLLQRELSPKILVLDWMMPKIDGIQLCIKIREQIPLKPYIILLTQNTGTTNIIRGLDAGADEFLTKPFKMTELRSRLAVAARIVAYENILTNFANKIASYTDQIHEILNLTYINLNELTSLMQEKTADLVVRLEKIAEIKANLEIVKKISTDIQNQK